MDKYANTVLTVIAFALVLIAAQNTITPAKAKSEGCGTQYYDPCYVKLVN